MKARTFDKKFDGGDDVATHVEWSRATRPNAEVKRVNVDFPRWVIDALDVEARRLGVTRQSLIKVWIAEKLDVPGKAA